MTMATLASSYFMIDNGKATEDNIVIYEEGILTDPVPRWVEAPGLQKVKYWLNPFYVCMVWIT